MSERSVDDNRWATLTEVASSQMELWQTGSTIQWQFWSFECSELDNSWNLLQWLDPFPRSFPVEGEVANLLPIQVTDLLRTCRLCCELVTDLPWGSYGETVVKVRTKKLDLFQVHTTQIPKILKA